MKRKLFICSGIVLVLVIGALVGVRVWIGQWVSRESLIVEMEKGWNCRADIASVSLSLFSSPAIVEIHGLQLSPRTDDVAVPLASRMPIDPGQVLLSAGKIDLTITLSDLIHRRAAIERLHVQDFNLRDEEDFASGGKEKETHQGLLDDLFARPDDFEEVEEKPEPSKRKDSAHVRSGGGILSPAAELPVASSGAEERRDPLPQTKKIKRRRLKKEHEHKPFKASDLVMALDAKEVSVSNAHIDLRERRIEMDKKGNVTERRERHTVFNDVNVALKNLDIAPDDLEHHNRSSLELGGTIELDQVSAIADEPPQSRKMVRLEFSSSGFIRPFDAATGEWNPDFTIEAKFLKGSLFGGVPLKESLRDKDMKKLTDWGLDIGDLSLGGVIGKDAMAVVHYFRGGKLVVKSDAVLVFPDYEITLREDSWFNTHEDLHNARCVLALSPELSNRILDQAKAQLIRKANERLEKLKEQIGDLGSGLAPTLVAAAEKAVKFALMEEGRLKYKFISKGRISKPVQNWDNDLKDLKDTMSSMGSGALDLIFNKK